MALTAAKISEIVGGELKGAPTRAILNLLPLELAGPSDISFFSPTSKNQAQELFERAKISRAGLILLPKFETAFPADQIQIQNPMRAVIKVAHCFYQPSYPAVGIDPLASVHPTAEVDPSARIGPFAVISEGAQVGAGTVIFSHAVIYAGARVGNNCIIHSGAAIREGVTLGDDCLIQNGAVVGGDGFGYIPDPQVGHRRIPHIGTVVLESGVDLGANATVDRATFGETHIGKNTKLDNLVMVGHNVKIGERSLFCSQVGISGSTTIGNDVVLAGQVGVSDHAVIGDKVRATGQSGLMGTIAGGQDIAGTPAGPVQMWRRVAMLLPKLPELFKRVQRLEKSTGQSKEDNQHE